LERDAHLCNLRYVAFAGSLALPLSLKIQPLLNLPSSLERCHLGSFLFGYPSFLGASYSLRFVANLRVVFRERPSASLSIFSFLPFFFRRLSSLPVELLQFSFWKLKLSLGSTRYFARATYDRDGAVCFCVGTFVKAVLSRPSALGRLFLISDFPILADLAKARFMFFPDAKEAVFDPQPSFLTFGGFFSPTLGDSPETSPTFRWRCAPSLYRRTADSRLVG